MGDVLTLIPDKSARKTLSRQMIAVDDFDRAAEFIAKAANYAEETIERDALLIAAIIYYARPFSQNERDRENAPADSTLTGR